MTDDARRALLAGVYRDLLYAELNLKKAREGLPDSDEHPSWGAAAACRHWIESALRRLEPELGTHRSAAYREAVHSTWDREVLGIDIDKE